MVPLPAAIPRREDSSHDATMPLRIRMLSPRGNNPRDSAVRMLRLAHSVTFDDLSSLLQRTNKPWQPHGFRPVLVFFRASDRSQVGQQRLDFVQHALATPDDVLFVQEVVLMDDSAQEPHALAVPRKRTGRRWIFGDNSSNNNNNNDSNNNEPDDELEASFCLKNDDQVMRHLLPRRYGGAGPPLDGVFDSEVRLERKREGTRSLLGWRIVWCSLTASFGMPVLNR
jgi:hypothetical protein